MFRGSPVVGPARRSNSVAVLAPVFVFVKPNKNRLISRKPNSYLNHFQPLLFYTIPPPLDQYNLFLFLQKTGAKTASRAPKMGYFDGRAPQLSARVNYGKPATAGVIGHMSASIPIEKDLKDSIYSK